MAAAPPRHPHHAAERGREQMEMNERMARMEARFEDHIARYDRAMDSMQQLHRDNRALIESIDGRMDRHDLQVARAAGAIALLVVLANLFGPVISHWLGAT